VGRIDLYGETAKHSQAEKLYSSLNEKLLPLGDHVIIYPAHGAGSVCGSEIADNEYSTIGYEKRTNPFLNLSKDEFIKRTTIQGMLIPPYFRKMEELNLKGPPILKSQEFPHALTVKEFEAEMNQPNTIVIDTRMPNAFAGAFIPNSLSIWMGGTTVYLGWLIDYNQRILFVHERNEDMKKVAKYFWRLGYDLMTGYLCNGMGEWQEEGKPMDAVKTISVHSLKEKLEKKQVRLVDVREPHEWNDDGFIEGVQRIFFGHLSQATQTIPNDKPIAVICSVGKRSSIAASILKRAKFTEVYNVLGGMTAWTKMGYPTKKSGEAN
jgi:hydroxyacylglutathione hydrolase